MKNVDNRVYIYTDGACSKNPGPGGWGVVLKYKDTEKELSGGEELTTNNKMELTAVIEGLKALKKPCEVVVVSDSKYVTDAINKGWLATWQKNGFKKADKKPVLNVELWQSLCDLLAKHKVKFEWVKGHSDNEYNNRCDELAVSYYKAKKL